MSPALSADHARTLVAESPVARLATVNPGLGVDVVPVTFALLEPTPAGDGDGPEQLVTAVDHKPKSTTKLRRLRNIADHPDVTVLIDHYENDWDRLWWVRIRGRAAVVSAGPVFDKAVDRLVERYDQYHDHRPQGPAIVIDVIEWTGWQADAAGR